MRYPASETAEKHERILTEAARLFRERGFSGVGVAEIMKAAGLTHGAFYAHFPSKDALAAEAVERAFAESDARVHGPAKVGRDARQSFLDTYLSARHRDDAGRGCAIAALGPEIARDPAVRAPFTTEVKRMIARLSDGAGRNAPKGSRQEAIHLLSAAVGALILARAVDDPELSDEILASMRGSLASG
jgi:TetR/AcrR family transcriptional repressor of nem operon